MSEREKIKTYNGAYYKAHKKEIKAQCKAYYEANRERRNAYKQEWHRNYGKYRRHGITKGIFNTMFEAQGEKCAICGTTDWGCLGPMIDHNHDNGKVRGILCLGCNTAIGYLKDDPEIAKALADYLERV